MGVFRTIWNLLYISIGAVNDAHHITEIYKRARKIGVFRTIWNIVFHELILIFWTKTAFENVGEEKINCLYSTFV